MKRRTWIIIGVVVLLAGGVIGLVSTRGQASAPSTASQLAQGQRTTLGFPYTVGENLTRYRQPG